MVLAITNYSLLTGYVPQSFKTALIKPILKKHNLDPNELTNYRPISNLPYFSKLLEKTVARQLHSHLEENCIFEDFQSGFRPNFSTEKALIKVLNDLLLATDDNLVSALVLLDLSAAFETLDHSILLHRLECVVGIRGSALDWFRTYLLGRQQYITINTNYSECASVKFGVPQGSVLGPNALRSVYASPWTDYSKSKHAFPELCRRHSVISSIKPDAQNQFNSLDSCLSDIQAWMRDNYLMLNPDKTEIIILGHKRHRDALSLHSLPLMGQTIIPAASVKNLGVIIDQDLSFKPHINQICKNAYFHL